MPEALGSLSNLKELYFHHNRLSTLPESIGRLKNLRILRVNNNLLLRIPETLGHVALLENIDISENQLQEVQQYLFQFPQLKVFSLTGNPFTPAMMDSVETWANQAQAIRNVIIHLHGPPVIIQEH